MAEDQKSQGGDHDHVIEVQSFFMSIEHATHVKWQDLGSTIAEVVLTIFTPVDIQGFEILIKMALKHLRRDSKISLHGLIPLKISEECLLSWQ